jgi:hypothetical protein
MNKTKKVIRIHNPMMALPSFSFGGIEAYSTRAMSLCGGVTIVADCGNPDLLLAAHEYLRRLGLGPDELILVRVPENGDLYQAILDNESLRARLITLVQNDGYKIEFFCTRNNIEETFICDLGLDWREVISHPSALADIWNDKSRLRLIARANGLESLFPAHCVVNDEQELDRCVRQMLHQYPELVIKRPLWASGLGMVFGNDASIIGRYCEQHRGVPAGTIVERSLGAEHLSMSIVTEFDDGRIIDRWFTEQECPQQDGSIVYEGSILGDMPQVNVRDMDWMEQATAPLYELIRTEHPYLTGVVNFDCLRYNDERFVSECNARATFSTYVHKLRRALLSARAVVLGSQTSEATCLVRKVVPRSARDFESLRTILGSTLLTDPRQTGVIPIALGCLATAGYCYLVAVADSYLRTLEIMAEARIKLEA